MIATFHTNTICVCINSLLFKIRRKKATIVVIFFIFLRRLLDYFILSKKDWIIPWIYRVKSTRSDLEILKVDKKSRVESCFYFFIFWSAPSDFTSDQSNNTSRTI